MSYELLNYLAPGVAYIRQRRGAETFLQLWTRVKIRKAKECGVCGQPITPGSRGYAPITNQGNRYCRLHVACVENGVR